MQIGELLLEQRKLRRSDLDRALVIQPPGIRLCSFLIAEGFVDFDDASRALGEQRGVACALTKHLAGRDRALATLIPAELGRGSCALPIGKTSKGATIVCVRDPAPALLAALQQAIRDEVLMIVAPAAPLEQLVAEAYGTSNDFELDIDFDSVVEANPLAVRAASLAAGTDVPRGRLSTPLQGSQPLQGASPLRSSALHGSPPLQSPLQATLQPPIEPPLPDMSVLDPESIRMSLTDLDDVRVEKDPTQSGHMPKLGGMLPTHNNSVNTPSPFAPQRLVSPDSSTVPSMTLAAMQDGLEHAASREAATDVALAYVATRWVAGLVLAVRDRAAIGYRGHAVLAPEAVTVSLGSPSTVQRAVQSKFVSVEAPNGVGQSALTHALNGSKAPAAAPVMVSGQAVAVIAVGDPLEGADARDALAVDLALVAAALGTAYSRLMQSSVG